MLGTSLQDFCTTQHSYACSPVPSHSVSRIDPLTLPTTSHAAASSTTTFCSPQSEDCCQLHTAHSHTAPYQPALTILPSTSEHSPIHVQVVCCNHPGEISLRSQNIRIIGHNIIIVAIRICSFFIQQSIYPRQMSTGRHCRPTSTKTMHVSLEVHSH